jgi:hypothetical protein
MLVQDIEGHSCRAESKQKFTVWLRGLVKGYGGGNSCLVRDKQGALQPELYHHIMGVELDEIEGELTKMQPWATQCQAAGIPAL